MFKKRRKRHNKSQVTSNIKLLREDKDKKDDSKLVSIAENDVKRRKIDKKKKKKKINL